MTSKKKAATKKPAAVKSQVEKSSTTDQGESKQDKGQSRKQEDETQTVPEYTPMRQTLEHEDFDHHADEEKRQAELAAERDEHNRRTGDASLR